MIQEFVERVAGSQIVEQGTDGNSRTNKDGRTAKYFGIAMNDLFYANHDGWYESHFSKDFDEFVTRATRNAAHLLSEELGCYARYSDGKTSIQWIPESYTAGD